MTSGADREREISSTTSLPYSIDQLLLRQWNFVKISILLSEFLYSFYTIRKTRKKSISNLLIMFLATASLFDLASSTSYMPNEYVSYICYHGLTTAFYIFTGQWVSFACLLKLFTTSGHTCTIREMTPSRPATIIYGT